MKQFELVLKNEKEVSYKRISILLLVLNLVGILFITYLKNFKSWGPFIIAAVAVFATFIFFYFRNKNEKVTLIGAFLLLSIAWIVAGYWVVGVLNIVFMILPFLKRKLIGRS
jgi:hypothetical protein